MQICVGSLRFTFQECLMRKRSSLHLYTFIRHWLMHVPFMHVGPAGHGQSMGQVLQFSAVIGSQYPSPQPDSWMQVPFLQYSPASHFTRQSPQKSGLFIVSLHCLEHEMRPSLQSGTSGITTTLSAVIVIECDKKISIVINTNKATCFILDVFIMSPLWVWSGNKKAERLIKSGSSAIYVDLLLSVPVSRQVWLCLS